MIKIQSISDIITNSSSEVFVIHTDDVEECLNKCHQEATFYTYPAIENDYLISEILEYTDLTLEELADCTVVDLEDHYDYDHWKRDCNTLSNYCIYQYTNR